MQRDLHNPKQVPINFKNLVHYIGYAIVHFIIVKGLFQNTGKFKPGDIVKYNWKARYYLGKTFLNSQHKNGLKQIVSIITYKDGSQAANYVDMDDETEEGSCDVFWIKKAYIGSNRIRRWLNI
jgi:hypothetical protein